MRRLKGLKRKVIRVESEETQDYAREAKSAAGAGRSGREDFRSEKTLSYWQLASVVIDEGEESYTTNLCQMRFNNSLEGKRRETIDKR